MRNSRLLLQSTVARYIYTFLLGIVVVGGSTLVLIWITDSVYFGKAESFVLGLAPNIPLLLALIAAIVTAVRLHGKGWGFIVVGGGCVAYFPVFVALFGPPLFLEPAIFLGPADATRTLFWAAPVASSAPADKGMLYFTADELNREHHGYGSNSWGHITHITYVGAHEQSSGTYVVSVNPIDKYTWSAVARSSFTGTCYAVLWYSDPSNVEYGGTLYGQWDASQPCMASRATRATVTQRVG